MFSKKFFKIHAVLRKLHMIQHMTTLTMWPSAPWPMGPIPQGTSSLYSIFTTIPLYPCVPLPMCPIAHVPHPPRCPISICSINHDTHLPMCPIAHMSWRCQKDVKLSKRCQISKSQTHGLWRRFIKKVKWHNEVHTHWCQFWHHIWSSPKTLKISIESIFNQFWWPLYLTSKLTSICVNLTVSIYFLCEPLP